MNLEARAKRIGAARRGGQAGFTLVELLIVMVLSLVLLAGMIGILDMAFSSFNTHRNLQAITDSSRRVMASMQRQVKAALFLVDANCGRYEMMFYADVTGQHPDADVESYTKAELVEFSHGAAEGAVMEAITPPPHPGVPVVSTLGSHVEGVRFYYFGQSAVPVLKADPAHQHDYKNEYIGEGKNEDVGMVRIVLDTRKGNISRSFYTDVFLRVLSR